MTTTNRHIQASRNYNARAYDRVELKVRKGEKKGLQTYASSKGESLNGFINRAIKETLERDNVILDIDNDVMSPSVIPILPEKTTTSDFMDEINNLLDDIFDN